MNDRQNHWDRRFAEWEFPWGTGPNRFLVQEVSAMRSGRALDLACGEGRNAVWLAAQGWQVTGVDISGVALDRARRLASAAGVQVDWLQADLRDYEPDRGAFDLVILFYYQVEEQEHRLVLRRAVSAVAEEGTLLVVGHHLDNLTDGYGGPKDPGRLFTPQDVVDAISELRIERAERLLRPVATDAGTVDAVDALVRARR